MSPFGISATDNNSFSGGGAGAGAGAGSEWYATGSPGNVYNNSNSNGTDAAAAAARAEAEDATATAACAATVANLEAQKASAVASEDYMRAAAAKSEIAKVMELEATRQALVQQQRQARAEAQAAAQAQAQAAQAAAQAAAAKEEAARVQAENDAGAAAAAPTAATGGDPHNVGGSATNNDGNLLGVEEDLLGLSDTTAVPVALGADYALLPPPVPSSSDAQDGSTAESNPDSSSSSSSSSGEASMKEAELLTSWVEGIEEVASTYHLESKPSSSSAISDSSSSSGGGVGGSKQRKALTDAIVVGSGVCLASNPKLLPMHAFSLFSALKALCTQHRQGGSNSQGTEGNAMISGGGNGKDGNADDYDDDNSGEKLMVAAGTFVMEVLGRWFHQASTRELGMLGAISVKIWVVPLSAQHHACLVHELEHLLEAALAQDAKEAPGGNATKVLKQIITFLYHNVDLIHGAPRHHLLNMILQVGFLRLFLNHSVEVMYGFHLLLVYKLLRFHRHHAGSASDVELLTSHGGPILKLNQLKIIETLKAVADRKTAAADPWKGTRPDGSPIEVEDLDIDRALQSQAHIFLDTIKAAPLREDDNDNAASRVQAAAERAQAATLAAHAARHSPSPDAAAEPEDLLCLDAPLDGSGGGGVGSSGSDAAAQAAALAQAEEAEAHAQAQAAAQEAAARAEAVEARVAVPKSNLPLVGPAVANFVRQVSTLWTENK